MNIKNAGLTLPSVMLMSSVTILAGCMNGVYTVDSKIDYDDEKTGALKYEVLTDSSYSFKDRNLRGDTIPIFVKEEKSVSTDDHSGLMLLWGLTLGVFPYYHSSSAQYTVSVKSPIGAKEATYSVNTRDWAGWFPCLIPVPGWGVERTYGKETDSETRDRIAGEIHNKVVKSLVGEFSKDEYATYVKSVEDQRAKEAERIKQKISELEGFMTAGKFEEAIVACREERTKTGKEEPWKGLIEKGIGGLRDSVPTIKDVKRLASMFALTDDAELREAVVLQLGALKEVKSLSADALNKIVAESTKKDVKIAAIQGIERKADLFQIAKMNRDAEVVISAFKKINDADSVRKFVWDEASGVSEKTFVKTSSPRGSESRGRSPSRGRGAMNAQSDEQVEEGAAGAPMVDLLKFNAYVEVYGTEDEMLKILNSDNKKLTPEICSVIQNKFKTEKITNRLKVVNVERFAAKFKDAFEYNLFHRVLPEIENIQNSSMQSAVAEYALEQHIKCNENKVYVPNNYGFSSDRELTGDMIKRFVNLLSPEYCNRLLDHIDTRGERGWAFMDCLIARLTEPDRARRIAAIRAKVNNGNQIHFEGFRIGMTWGDCCLLGYNSKKSPSSAWHEDGVVYRLQFKRANRYAMFEKEDGEFWAAFLKKYVPAGKPKSIGATIEDALNESAFEYQQGYDSKLEEMCYIYKSMKYGTKVLFGLDSGTLELRQLK